MAEKYDFKVLHYDEIALKGKHIDEFAKQICEKVKPDVLLCTLLGTEKCNPTETFFQPFKDAGCKIIFLWPDFGRSWTINSAARFDKFIDLNVAIACEKNGNYSKTLWTWTPEDPTYFYFDGSVKDIDVSFLGTIHSPERQEILNYLKTHLSHLKIHLGGGQRQEKLSHEKYAELTRRSKIIVNFPYSVAGNDQLKGRVFEATASKCLLMDRKNDRTREFFKPNKEYIEYTSKEDLVEKIIFYLGQKDLEALEEIANAGYKRFNKDWSHNEFWTNVFKELYK